jgi:hypothetical protein
VDSLPIREGIYTLSPYAKAALNLTVEDESRKAGARAAVDGDGRGFAQKFRILPQTGDAYAI